MDSLDRVHETVLDRVSPGADERDRLDRVAAELTHAANRGISELPVDADVTRVGSTARGTWLAGDRDIDLFVRFSPGLDRDKLERYGLQIGHTVLPDGHEEYAEHPYVTGTYEGFDIDLVPCYAVEDASGLVSAVDRTPFHNEYLSTRLTDELREAVRVCKRFFKGIGVYGSDLKTQGFSGYLTELLVVEHGGFAPLIDAAAEWRPPVVYDPESHGTSHFDDPLVVIDPTDSDRNVAAVVSAENVARLQHYARELRADPHLKLFFPPPVEPLSPAELNAHLRRRGTSTVAIVFETPNIVEDQLYPQLRKSRRGLVSEFDRRGFGVCRSTTVADAQSVILVELETDTLPAIERHEGPPVHVKPHAEGFTTAYESNDDVYGPFLDGDRYVVERPREFTDARAFLQSDQIFEVGLGTHIESALESGYDIRSGDELATLCEPFGRALREYFEPTP